MHVFTWFSPPTLVSVLGFLALKTTEKIILGADCTKNEDM